jgi:hypothetical protein
MRVVKERRVSAQDIGLTDADFQRYLEPIRVRAVSEP